MSDTPRTEADKCPSCGGPVFLAGVTYRGSAVREAAALDVERLAEAMLTRDFSTLHHCYDCFAAEAEVIARIYTRLSEPSKEPRP